MRLLEYQGKDLFEKYEIPIPRNVLIAGKEEIEVKVGKSKLIPGIMKAQVPVGGRGKAGGVKKVETRDEAFQYAKNIFNSDIKGQPVEAVLLEDHLEVEREIYIGFLLNRSDDCITGIASEAGGVDIEQVAETEPEKIARLNIDPAIGLQDYTIRFFAKQAGIESTFSQFREIVRTLYNIFVEMDATLIEVNPLGLLSNSLMALDSKVLLDDSAEHRQRDRISSYKEQREEVLSKKRTKAEKMAREIGLSYVELDGNIGLISDGAGTGMLTLDVIKDFGGKPADFCEMGGEADATIMEETMEVVMANHKVEGLLITLIGGLTRMDEIAKGIANYFKKNDTTIPLAIRMCGTKENVGKEILENIGLQTFDDHQEAVKSIVKKVDKG